MRHIYRGKVRDVYEVDDRHLLMVASDRISAFDVVMPEPVPDKGRVLTAITAFWLDQMADVAPSHLVSVDPADFPVAARDISLAVYTRGAAWAAARGILIADTKFELGLIDGALAICDEVLTPDSSRFWPADEWAPGTTPPSFDKQPVRDWLEATGWDKKPPPPNLPAAVVTASRERYITAYERITGNALVDWYGVGE